MRLDVLHASGACLIREEPRRVAGGDDIRGIAAVRRRSDIRALLSGGAVGRAAATI
ncbi:hypothetical protein OG978_05950 [Streptomyces sp. NBC_01591]|uniref:hypothetical protein n=1 Tax=Streptomyces sp. NBC_01591 TaxID=2975888 RepID=UPI002DD842B6|nr:hypothetical protein [Streptomyces sp. NBC_01591]WSD66964.1 hypothetical protein OG978_05950 [Streptomyces sp. NBC_01591]